MSFSRIVTQPSQCGKRWKIIIIVHLMFLFFTHDPSLARIVSTSPKPHFTENENFFSLPVAVNPENLIRKSTNSIYFMDLQQHVLTKRFRFSLFSGLQNVDGPIGCTDIVYGASVHTLLHRTEKLENYLVLEGAYARGRKMKSMLVDEDESIEMQCLNTTTYNLNFEFVGLSWLTNNPLKIFPYTSFGVGLVSRPSRSDTTTRHFGYEEEEVVTIEMKDAGTNAGSVNFGLGFQIYYLSRIDFRIFLVRPSSAALYRVSASFIF